MKLHNNTTAMGMYRNYSTNRKGSKKSLEKLASGSIINRAADDAAGLTISEQLRAQAAGLKVAQRNSEDGVGLVQTVEGALVETQDMLKRMYALGEQSASELYDNSMDRAQMSKEFQALADEIDRIGESANYNGIKLLDGSMAGPQVTTTVGSADPAVPTKVEIDFTGIGGKKAIGGTMEIGGKRYRFIDAAASPAPEPLRDCTDVSVSQDATGSQVAQALIDKMQVPNAPEGFTVSGPTPKLTLTESAQPAVGAAPPSVVSSGVGGLSLQVGDTSNGYNMMRLNLNSIRKDVLRGGEGQTLEELSVDNQENAATAMQALKGMVNYVSDIRGKLGAAENRLDHNITNLSAVQANVESSDSVIRDTSVAQEIMVYTKSNILMQSSQSMMAQANQLPEGVLLLMRE